MDNEIMCKSSNILSREFSGKLDTPLNTHIIDGGCILLSRQILKSDIWRKPPEYLKIFLYILLRVNHKDGLFPRGSNFFNFSDERPSGVTKDQIYKFLSWAKSEKVQILATQKSTRGVVIKVNNYDKYQSLENYQRQDEWQDNGRTAAEQRQDNGSTINNNERMKELNNVISIDKQKTKKRKKFVPPTFEEVKKYCLEVRKNNINYKKFYDYYSVSKWKDSRGKPIVNWKQKIIAVWERDLKKSNVSAAEKKQNNESFYMSLSR